MYKAPSNSLIANLRACIEERPCIYSGCLRKFDKASLSRRQRSFSTSKIVRQAPIVPFRKQLKDEAKARKQNQVTDSGSSIAPDLLAQYELTVGIEIHAELSTSRKLFSSASTSLNSAPNQHVAGFDAAIPGTQPTFQKATLLPAIRAALALGCEIRPRSGWDRKHYFWWDQPQGYQITQYYDPFATTGSLSLTTASDGVPQDITIGIKQVQMEQDTAKTVLQPPRTHLLDFNRVSHPLIEIISLPHIHDPITAAAFVRKVQKILKAVGACETGMEMGGLRADVNVSVKKRTDPGSSQQASFSYSGVTGLGQRTEIKNLSTLTGISTAIALERDRQIKILAEGGSIEGETRGWTLGATSTHRIRGKEGEVDYRYMPDPDLAPLLIGEDLVSHLRQTLPETPEATVERLEKEWGVSGKDARTLVELDDGDRCEYFFEVAHMVLENLGQDEEKLRRQIGRTAANWVLHEIGAVLTTSQQSFSMDVVQSRHLASILTLLHQSQITLPTAKNLVAIVFEEEMGAFGNVEAYVDANSLRLQALSDAEYLSLAEELVQENQDVAERVRKEAAKPSKKGSSGGGKMMWFVGQMVRKGEAGRVQPERAEKAVRHVLGL